MSERERFGRARRIGTETIDIELGQRVVFCMGAENRWQGFYRKFLILNRTRPTFWAEWIQMLLLWHWDERYDAAGKRLTLRQSEIGKRGPLHAGR